MGHAFTFPARGCHRSFQSIYFLCPNFFLQFTLRWILSGLAIILCLFSVSACISTAEGTDLRRRSGGHSETEEHQFLSVSRWNVCQRFWNWPLVRRQGDFFLSFLSESRPTLTSLHCGSLCGKPWLQNIWNQTLSTTHTYGPEAKLKFLINWK